MTRRVAAELKQPQGPARNFDATILGRLRTGEYANAATSTKDKESDEDTTAPGGLMKDTHGPRPDRPRMSGERLELRRLTGKFALLVTFIYLLVLLAAAYGLQHDDSLPTFAYALILAPAAAFVLATIDAIALHRTREPDRTKALHRRCAVHTLIALALLGSTAVSISHLQP